MIELIVPDANTLADLIPRVRAVIWKRTASPPATAIFPYPRSAPTPALNRALSKRVTPWHSAPKRSP